MCEAGKVDVLGVRVSPTSLDRAMAQIEHWIRRQEKHYVCVRDVHGLIECQADSELKRIHNEAGLVVPDGVPIVWMCRALGFPQTGQVYGPDLMRALSSRSAERGYRQFYYGGNHGVAELLAGHLRSSYPGLSVVGTHTPPFRELTHEESMAIVEKINASNADIVWVGLSTPKQEKWIARHRSWLKAPVLIGVGAAFDFIPGLKSEPPIAWRRVGMAWMYRLASEPKRLWRRYLYSVPVFLVLAGRQLAQRKLVPKL